MLASCKAKKRKLKHGSFPFQSVLSALCNFSFERFKISLQMSNNNIAWASVALINEILTLLDFSDTPNYDLGEVNGTLSKTKQILGKHLSQKLNINAYDVSLQGIKDVLVKIKMKLIDIDFAENKKKEKIQILRLDLLLSYRVGQFESLFNINDNGVAISQVSSFFESNEGRDFWIQNFGDKLMIPWNTFYKVYCSTLQTILSTEEQLTLRNFVGLNFFLFSIISENNNEIINTKSIASIMNHKNKFSLLNLLYHY